MSTSLPPLRALQAFEAFGRLGTVHGAAKELGVTPGAISQQLRLLEDHVGIPLIQRDGRGAMPTAAARVYHEMISQGFDRLFRAQDFIASHRVSEDLTISGLPTLIQKWLNPLIHRFQETVGDTSIRLIATHREMEPIMLEQIFRLTYGQAAQRYPHTRALFTDTCFPACSPAFLATHPEAVNAQQLIKLPLIGIDWGMDDTAAPHWSDWFASEGVEVATPIRPVAVHSLSSTALESAVVGRGVVLAQSSFAAGDLESGRLVRLSPRTIPMPGSYFICWGTATLNRGVAREFLNWILAEAKAQRNPTIENS